MSDSRMKRHKLVKLLVSTKHLPLSGPSGKPVKLNPALIEIVRQRPDTTISLITGDTMVVRETPAQLAAAIAKEHARLTRRGFAYALVRKDLGAGLDPTDLGELAKVEKLMERRAKPRLQKLGSIYWNLLTSFVPFLKGRRGRKTERLGR